MSCCVVIPVYCQLKVPLEIVSFLRLRQLIKKDVFLVAPIDLNLDSYQSLWPEISIVRFENSHFDSISAYNKLMLSKGFYTHFASNYEWLLIHQLDAFLFHDNLTEFCSMEYDYFGAPWRPAQLIRPSINHPRLLQLLGKRVAVGNGGLSLRRLSAVIDLISRKENVLSGWNNNEDGFYSYFGSGFDKFKSCPTAIASRFSLESQPKFWLKKNKGKLPFGCHAFNKIEQDSYAELINPILKDIAGLKDLSPSIQLPYPYQI